MMAQTLRRRLILHVGQAKAGSTAIQNYLTSQRSELKRQGVLFPETYLLRRNSFDPSRSPGHFGLISAAASDDLSDLERELSDSQADTLVLSIESLFADLSNVDLQNIAKQFEGWEICLIAVLRHPNRWIVSRYIEEVMSCNRYGAQTLTEFIHSKAAALLYADRIDTLIKIFKPHDALLLNYDYHVAKEGLLPAFLEAVGLPITNLEFASGLRSNVREKSELLVECKRRLNVVLPNTSLRFRQELELKVRNHVSAMASNDRDMEGEMPSYIPLPEKHGKAVHASNQRLEDEFGLSPPFPALSGDTWDTRRYRKFFAKANDLNLFGLKAAAQLSRDTANQPIANLSDSSLLSVCGSEMLMELLAQIQVSLHLDSPESALWAGSFARKLPLSLASKTSIAESNQLLSVKLPSEIIQFRQVDISPVLAQRKIQAIVVPVGVTFDLIANVWEKTGRGALLVLIGHDRAEACEISDRLKLTFRRSSGQVSFLIDKSTFQDKDIFNESSHTNIL